MLADSPNGRHNIGTVNLDANELRFDADGSLTLVLSSEEPEDPEAKATLANTRRLSEVSPKDFDAVFYPGGHGPLWDLAEDPTSIKLIEGTLAAGKPVAAVCHAPAVLKHVKSSDGKPLVQGKSVTGFANTEEEAVGLTNVVPFLVEDMLRKNGGTYSKGADWNSHVVTDGLLITGQNPASSTEAARALLKQLG